jgi:hypothetical protein
MTKTSPPPPPAFKSFKEFYPFYLSEHSLPWTRRLHFVGTTLGLGLLANNITVFFAAADDGGNNNGMVVVAPLIIGYGFAWVSHFFIEKNRPATFKYPLWSLCGDLKMWSEMIQGRLWNLLLY